MKNRLRFCAENAKKRSLPLRCEKPVHTCSRRNDWWNVRWLALRSPLSDRGLNQLFENRVHVANKIKRLIIVSLSTYKNYQRKFLKIFSILSVHKSRKKSFYDEKQNDKTKMYEFEQRFLSKIIFYFLFFIIKWIFAWGKRIFYAHLV